MMDVCGEAESRLATELMQHEVNLERDILDPLNQLAEVKQKKMTTTKKHSSSSLNTVVITSDLHVSVFKLYICIFVALSK